MPTPKLFSRAMIAVILLCLFQVTLVTLVCSFIIAQFFVSGTTQDVFLYLIDFAAPVTLLTTISNGLNIGLGILVAKSTEPEEEEKSLIIMISNIACVITIIIIPFYEIVYYIIFHFSQLIRNFDIIIIPVVVFGLFFIYLAVRYVLVYVFIILNTIIGSLTNKIFNLLFSNVQKNMKSDNKKSKS